MFILKQWTVINMFDWVEAAIAVSETKDRLVDHAKHEKQPLIDYTDGGSIKQYCEQRNLAENRVGKRTLTPGCFDCYLSIDTIEVI